MNDGPDSAPMPEVRKGQGDVKLSREEFARRIGERFYDPAFDGVRNEVERIIDIAWNGYDQYRKSPRTRKAGAAFADPDFELPVEWLETRARILKAECLQRDLSSPRRILLVCGAARHDQTCPGEMSKTFRLAQLAREVIEESDGFECDVLDLSMLTAQYGRPILPCKVCVSTAMPLCHWPCSCYPNHAMGQASDWMNELYPRWVAAHGIMIVTPVYWYQTPSVLKLMIERLVCADGGNPDPTTTGGKNPAKAKALELAGWPYPRHLAGRAFYCRPWRCRRGRSAPASADGLVARHEARAGGERRDNGPLHRLLRIFDESRGAKSRERGGRDARRTVRSAGHRSA
jgi:multimeric flavodoxin WrbA